MEICGRSKIVTELFTANDERTTRSETRTNNLRVVPFFLSLLSPLWNEGDRRETRNDSRQSRQPVIFRRVESAESVSRSIGESIEKS